MSNKDNKKDKKKNKGKGQSDRLIPGAIFPRARREKGLSSAEVEQQLGLTPWALKALESNEYDKLPAPIYVRGYIRRYCKLLDIASEELLASYETYLLETGPTAKPFDMPPEKAPSQMKWLVSVVLVMVLIALVWVLQRSTDVEQATTSAESFEKPQAAVVSAATGVIASVKVAPGLVPVITDRANKLTSPSISISNIAGLRVG